MVQAKTDFVGLLSWAGTTGCAQLLRGDFIPKPLFILLKQQKALRERQMSQVELRTLRGAS